MPAKRGDRVAPPARPGMWEARSATSEAAKGWGPRLASGERTLILVSDNNFADEQVTQIVALALR